MPYYNMRCSAHHQVHGLVADVSLAADVRRVSKELDEKLGPNRGECVGSRYELKC